MMIILRGIICGLLFFQSAPSLRTIVSTSSDANFDLLFEISIFLVTFKK